MIRVLTLILASTLLLSACNDTTAECKGVSSQQYQSLGVEDGDCIGYKAAKQRECWQAQVLDVMYNAMGIITIDAYNKLTVGAMNLMMVLFSVWFAFSILKYVSSLEGEEAKTPSKFWTNVLKQFFMCYICGYLASSSTTLIYVLNNIIYPVFNAFLELASYLLRQLSSVTNEGEEYMFFGKPYDQSQNVCQVTEQLKYQVEETGFPNGANQMMQCLICNVSEKLNIGFGLAFKLISIGILIPKLIGITILVIFTFIKLGFVFYLVETVFKFTMMVVLLPIFIMGFAFKQTKAWMSNGFKIILAGSAYMLTVSVVVSLSVVAIVRLIRDHPDIFDSGMLNFIEFSPVLLCLLMIAFLINKAMDTASKLSNLFVGEKISSKFQEYLGGTLRMVGQAIGILLSAGSAAPIFAKINVVRKIQAVKDKIDEAQEKIKELAGEEEDKDEEA